MSSDDAQTLDLLSGTRPSLRPQSSQRGFLVVVDKPVLHFGVCVRVAQSEEAAYALGADVVAKRTVGACRVDAEALWLTLWLEVVMVVMKLLAWGADTRDPYGGWGGPEMIWAGGF